MNTLNAKQKKRLKSLAHHLKPVVYIGKNGLSEKLIEAIDKALDDHELIKVKFIDFKDEKKSLSFNTAEETGAVLIKLIGNIAIFYRQNNDPDKRKIDL